MHRSTQGNLQAAAKATAVARCTPSINCLQSDCCGLAPVPDATGLAAPRMLHAAQTQEMIETFISYHDSIKKCVCIVYDPHRQQRGQVGLRAIRLKDSFIELFKEQKLTGGARSRWGFMG
jgi:hypothetical protein